MPNLGKSIIKELKFQIVGCLHTTNIIYLERTSKKTKTSYI